VIVNKQTIDELMTPSAFKRENYSAHLYAPYSIKLHRRVYIYTHDSYNLWVFIETNPKISSYNEDVEKIPISLEDGNVINISPRFIALKVDGVVEVHTILNNSQKPSDKKIAEINAWQRFCQLHGFNYQNWTSEELTINKVRLANYKKLLRYTSSPNSVVNRKLEHQVLSEISNVRKIVFYKILQHFPLSDPEDIKTSIARLIISNQVYSDLDVYPFSMLTEISAHHEFHSN